MKTYVRTMVGHGAIVLLIGMLAGTGLLASLLGGLELIPGTITSFTVPGDAGAWARAHVGGMMNGILIMLVAVVGHALALDERLFRRLRWMLIGTGYANTVFYWAALVATNRALSLADNRFGHANWASVVGLVPALIFVVVVIIAVAMLIRAAFATAD